VQSGLVPAGTATRPQPKGLRTWAALDNDQRAAQARDQAVEAGMMEAMDAHLGRLITFLRDKGANINGGAANTLFIVLADNGPEPTDPTAQPLMRAWLKGVGYSTATDTLGTRGTFAAIGPEMAQANATPFALFKFHAAEGGVRVPLIVAGPGVAPAQRIDAFTFITDLAPTLLGYAGAAPAPAPSPPLQGRTLAELLAGTAQSTHAAPVHAANEAIGMEAAGASALYKGAWKLVRDRLPYGDERWHLYNLEADPGETNDLAAAQPAVLFDLQREYARYADRVGVLPVPPGYTTTAELGSRVARALLARYAYWLAFAAIALLGGVAYIARHLWKRGTRAG
jgi:arylsulfatase A-like enzyme